MTKDSEETDAIERSRYVQIVILPEEGKWLVKYKDQDRICADRSSARKVAIQLAYESGQSGSPARVMLRRRDGKLVPIWAYDRDPPPLPTTQGT
jgi:hypothetical protein